MGTEQTARPLAIHTRTGPHNTTPHVEMGVGKRRKRGERKEERRGRQRQAWKEGIGEKFKGKETARTNVDKRRHNFSKQDRGGTHAKAQHEDSVYRGACRLPMAPAATAPQGGSQQAGERAEAPVAQHHEGLTRRM